MKFKVPMMKKIFLSFQSQEDYHFSKPFLVPEGRSAFCFVWGKTQVISNWSDLFRSHMLTVMSVPGGGYYTLLKFLQHFLFTQLQIPRVMLGRMASMVLKHERIPRNGCVSVRKSTRSYLKNDLFDLT